MVSRATHLLPSIRVPRLKLRFVVLYILPGMLPPEPGSGRRCAGCRYRPRLLLLLHRLCALSVRVELGEVLLLLPRISLLVSLAVRWRLSRCVSRVLWLLLLLWLRCAVRPVHMGVKLLTEGASRLERHTRGRLLLLLHWGRRVLAVGLLWLREARALSPPSGLWLRLVPGRTAVALGRHGVRITV